MTGDAFTGANIKYIEKSKEVLGVIKDLPKVPKSFTAFTIKSDYRQDIVGSWYYEPFGEWEIEKVSSNEKITKGNENYSLKSAKYGLYEGSKLVDILTTDESGKSKSEKVPEGDYIVKEMDSSKGYAIDKTVYEIYVHTDKCITLKVKEVPQSNPVSLIVNKIDSETGKGESQGNAGLKDAEYEVKFYPVSKDTDLSGAKASRSWIFRTDEEGKIVFDKAHLVSGDDFYYQSDGKTPCLPLGKVTFKETKASEGYLLDKNIYVVNITSTGNSETVKTFNKATSKEQVKRGDLDFVKVGDGTLERLKNVPFKLTSLTTGENHVLVTDRNGYASTSSSWNLHSNNTNLGKSSEDGVWFGESDPDDEKGALIYDDYILEELACEENQGMDLVKIKVNIYKDKVTVPLVTLTDDKIEVETTATDKDTGLHVGNSKDMKVTITDKVHYEGLKVGNKYSLKATLYNADTGEQIMDGDEPVIVTKEFVAKKSKGDEFVDIKVNSSLIKGKKTVVFEDLFLDDIRIAVHGDLEDEGQSVYYPEIGTKAFDKTSGSSTSYSEGKVTITDTVSYKNLEPGNTYTVRGYMVDSATGKEIKTADKRITTTKGFSPIEKDGEVKVDLTFDSSKVDVKSVVIYEELYLKDKLVAEHKDINSKNQTIIFPEIGTTAYDVADQDRIIEAGKVKIIDRVSYKNLVPGKEYEVKGILMDKKTGTPVIINGKTVEGTADFVPKDKNGNKLVEFNFNAKDLHGRDLVVYEKLYEGASGKLVCKHEDLKDKYQTVSVKEFSKAPRTFDNNWYGYAGILMFTGIMALLTRKKMLKMKRKNK